jgi:hypothetical protein
MNNHPLENQRQHTTIADFVSIAIEGKEIIRYQEVEQL